MADFEVTFVADEFEAQLRAMIQRGEHPVAAFKAIGERQLDSTQENFRKQGWPPGSFAPLSTNVSWASKVWHGGMSYAEWKEKKKPGLKILYFNNYLYSSISQASDDTHAIWGAAAGGNSGVYAAAHNFGYEPRNLPQRQYVFPITAKPDDVDDMQAIFRNFIATGSVA